MLVEITLIFLIDWFIEQTYYSHGFKEDLNESEWIKHTALNFSFKYFLKYLG